MRGAYDRRERIRRLKKIIITTIMAAIVIPVITSVILGIRVFQLQGRVRELEQEMAAILQQADEVNGVYTTAAVEESPRDTAQAGQLLDKGEKEDVQNYQKTVYLTFDDGPSRNTDKILDILKEYDVKATFFVVGKTDEHSVRAYQRIVEEGHTLAMHSYSHKYEEVYQSKESFAQDMSQLQEYLYQITGIWPRFYRFPGGSSNLVSQADMQELIGYLNENGITYFDWNVASGDAVSGHLSAESIAGNCLNGIENKDMSMILMHDAAEKNTTVEALPEIIQTIKDRGDSLILPITDETMPVQHVMAGQNH
ncbi:bifunctional xylanase/deacetylase [Lachnospiraceae bacterium]|nr:bifunctional xylanase/deacetylase [Lachnospiraceae bacterium]